MMMRKRKRIKMMRCLSWRGPSHPRAVRRPVPRIRSPAGRRPSPCPAPAAAQGIESVGNLRFIEKIRWDSSRRLGGIDHGTSRGSDHPQAAARHLVQHLLSMLVISGRFTQDLVEDSVRLARRNLRNLVIHWPARGRPRHPTRTRHGRHTYHKIPH
jgi:hypothetical protein